MNKNKVLKIILVITVIAILIVIVLSSHKKYNNYVISEKEWQKILDKQENKKLKLDSIKFNDYNLLIDESNNIIYYSIVEKSNKFNPSVSYKTNEKAKLAFKSELENDNIERKDVYKLIIYNNNYYHEYSLCITNYPLMEIEYQKPNSNSITMELFDNHVNRNQRYMKSEGKIKEIETDKYSLSLKMESLGHNRRDNPMSILGIEPTDEYILEKTNNANERKKYIRLFIDNTYDGIYTVDSKQNINNDERSI